MHIQEILTFIILLTAVFAYINHRFIKWPPTIGIMALSLISSILLALFGNSQYLLSQKVLQLASSVDFQHILMNFMLSFLLFAGAIHIDGRKLNKQRWPVIVLATVGTLISTFVVGELVWFLFKLFNMPIPLIYCFLFGALISPTDPIAVMGILKQAKIPSSLEMKIAGESLFNDGVGVVAFTILAEIAMSGHDAFSAFEVSKLIVIEGFGGLAYGMLLGYIGYWALRSIDDYKVEMLITLAVVMVGYFVAGQLHVSGPLSMVVAGLVMGNKVKNKDALSEVSRDYLGKFWELIDEMLNAILFLLIGLEMLTIKMDKTIMLIGSICIVIVLVARWISVAIPVFLLRYKIQFERYTIRILTWGGLRGGISVALALSLGDSMYRDEFVLITYIIVVFSILVQGLTIGKFAKRLTHS